MAHVHHTAGTNDYTRAQAPAVVRAIQLYHVKGNGWNDIGYNALVDRFGTVYEGRGGGVDRNVVGAHARGFNTGSFGIAVMGDFQRVEPPAAAVDALVRTLAWRLDLGYVDPLDDLQRDLLGQRALRRRDPRLPPRDLGSPRHGRDDVPRRAPLRTPRRDRPPCRRDRPPQALRAGGRGRRGRRRPHPRAPLVAARRGPSSSRTPTATSSAAARERACGRLGVGARRPGSARPALAARGAGPPNGRGHHRHARALDAPDPGGDGDPRDDLAERRRPGGHDDDRLHALR